MDEVLEGVRAHYGAAGLKDRLEAALGPESRRIDPSELANLDQFHTRGLTATAELAELAGISAQTRVLDLGSGVGGPARFLAATYGCEVMGIDLSRSFVEAARYLTERTGQTEQVRFEVGTALDIPVADASFDVVLLQHVAMNIADRTALYAEIARVLKASGRLAIFDVVTGGGDPQYPVPWARDRSTSFLLSADATCAAIEIAGFRLLERRDDTEAAKSWFADLGERGAPPRLNLGLIMGPDMLQLATNLGRNVSEGRLGILTAVFELEAPAN